MSEEERNDQELPEDDPGTGNTEPDTGEGGDLKAEVDRWKREKRKWEERAKSNSDAAKKLAEIEERDKTEQQKLSERMAEFEKRAAEAESKVMRFEVATEKEVPKHLHRFLTGSTREELEEQADALLEALKPAENEGGPVRRPRETLRSGVKPSAEGLEMDPRKLAAAIPRM